MPGNPGIFSSKKGIQLSINFLVIVILSIVMLTLGILLVQTFFGKTEEIKRDLDVQTKDKIAELLTYGEITALPYSKKTVSGGDQALFGLGVLNVDRENYKTFYVDIVPSKFVTKRNEVEDNPDVEDWLLYDDETFNLAPHESKQVSILVTPPSNARIGTYIFNVQVLETSGARYGNLNKMYVTIG